MQSLRSVLFLLIALASLLAGPSRGSAHSEAGPDVDRRIRFYQQALARDPELQPARVQLGLAYLDKARATGEPRWIARSEREIRRALGQQ